MRAFRPSHFAPAEEYEEEHQHVKDSNVEVYAKRAAAGVPLFELARGAAQAARRSAEFQAPD